MSGQVTNFKINRLLANEKRGYVIFAPNATRLKRRSVLIETTKVSPSFVPLETKEHLLEAGHYVDVNHAINDTRHVTTFINDVRVAGTIHKKHFDGAIIIDEEEK